MYLSKETLAMALNGREYNSEITDKEAQEAKAAGLVVVFGASDDLMEFRGAIYDECGACDGSTALVDGEGLLPERGQIDDDETLEKFFRRRKTARKIRAIWNNRTLHSWTYETDIPHATFEIVEDGAPYCRGIVFALADVTAAPAPAETVMAGQGPA